MNKFLLIAHSLMQNTDIKILIVTFLSTCILLAIANIVYWTYVKKQKKQYSISKKNYLRIKKAIFNSKLPRIIRKSLKYAIITLIVTLIFIFIVDTFIVGTVYPWFENQTPLKKNEIIIVSTLAAVFMFFAFAIRISFANYIVGFLFTFICILALCLPLCINIKLSNYLRDKKDIFKV